MKPSLAQVPSEGGFIRRERLVGVVLLLIHWGLAVASVRHKSATFDELGHLTAGVSNWRTGDFRLLPEHPPLPHLWAALPVVISNYHEPKWDGPDWHTSQVWNIGRRFLYDLGNDADGLLWRARVMMALFSVALGAIVWRWARKLFGPAGGLISLALYTFCPTTLAHAPLVTTDAAVSLFFVASVAALWHVLHKVTPRTILLSALAVSGLMLSKVSGVLILPMAAVLIGLRLLYGPPAAKQWASWLGAAAVHLLVVVVLLWMFYGFRYPAMRNAQAGRDRFFTPAELPRGMDEWEYELQGLGFKGRLISWARDHRLLPESYLFGFASTVKHAGYRAAFFNGETGIHGWRTFFPYSFLVKTPLPLFGALLLAAFARKGAGDVRSRLWRKLGEGFQRTAPLWTLFVVYWITAITSNLNIGHRHILPIYPVLYILAGRSAIWLSASRRWMRGLPIAAAGLLACVSLVRFPHYLSFFNTLVGGPSRGYKHLVDGSLDWGQGLPGLKRWLERRAVIDRSYRDGVSRADNDPTPPPVYFSYFGTAKPSYYGIDARTLPSYLPWQSAQPGALTGGTYCISATTLQQIGLLPECRWTPALEAAYREIAALASAASQPAPGVAPVDAAFFAELRFARLCAFLRQREPDAQVGHSIMIYELSDADIGRALTGAPPEILPDRPENLQRLADQAFESGSLTAAAVFYRRVLDAELAVEGEGAVRPYANLAAALSGLGQAREAVEVLRHGLEQFPNDPTLNNNLAWLLATHPSAELRDGAEALRCARIAAEGTGEPDPNTLDTLAAACAEVGEFEEAVRWAAAAAGVAQKQGDKELAGQIEGRIVLYRARRPYREP